MVVKYLLPDVSDDYLLRVEKAPYVKVSGLQLEFRVDKMQDMNLGVYTFPIVLTNPAPYGLSEKYTFKFTFINLESVFIEEVATEMKIFEEHEEIPAPQNLCSARISDISSLAMLTLEFSNPILTNYNKSDLNSTLVDMYIVGNSSNFTWTVHDFS
jgi:hypothetical protein